jgi:hypothetical protein
MIIRKISSRLAGLLLASSLGACVIAPPALHYSHSGRPAAYIETLPPVRHHQGNENRHYHSDNRPQQPHYREDSRRWNESDGRRQH